MYAGHSNALNGRVAVDLGDRRFSPLLVAVKMPGDFIALLHAEFISELARERNTVFRQTDDVPTDVGRPDQRNAVGRH